MKGKNRPVWCIALGPVPLITSNFPLQETFGSLNVGVLQIPRACVCVSGNIKGTRAGAKTWSVVENIRAAKYNNRWSPGITVSSIPRFPPAKPPAGHYWNLLSSSAELIRLLPALIPTRLTHRFIVPPPTVEVDWAVSPKLQHCPAAPSGLHITEYLWREEDSTIGTTSEPRTETG